MPVIDEDLAPSVPANMRANDEPTKQMVKDEKEACGGAEWCLGLEERRWARRRN